MPEKRQRILFVTGRLAEPSLRRVVGELSQSARFDYEIAVLGISVAALMHGDWVAGKLDISGHFDRVVLPGWCGGELQRLSQRFETSFERGPKNLFDLPEYFGQQQRPTPDLSEYDIEILAEINHAPRLSDDEIVRQAEAYRQSGADVVDLGCVPGETWTRAGEVTRILVQHGFRVAIDSFDRTEVESAVAAGAELVLSCNSSNLKWAAELDAELVAIPDTPGDTASLQRTVDELVGRGCRFRIDPILEPIGFGFASSLARYFDARRRWPDVEMLMGVGNLTELTEVDSAGVNLLLAAICQELGIRSVLTTEVINWSRSAVSEFAFARRLVYHSLHHRVLPKHLDSNLVLLRDPKLRELGEDELALLASRLTDPNYRIFVERGDIHVMNRDGHWRGTDAYELFDNLAQDSAALDKGHAFYLGYELSKAVTALTLGKQYTQDEALRWGFLTLPENSAIQRRRKSKSDTS